MASPHPFHIRPLLPALVAICGIALAQAPTPYPSVKPILDSVPQLPPSLQKGSEASWNAWRDKADRDIRARLTQGDVDTLINLLLFGTSFTTKPRIQIDTLAEASRSGLLIGRVNDLVAGLGRSGSNERLSYLRKVVTAQGVDPDDAKAAGAFILTNLQRVLQEKVIFAQRVEAAKAKPTGNTPTAKPADAFSESANLFQDRGISLDTTILPNFGVESALADMQKRGVLKPNSITRVAVIGPGLDFVDKESGFDYYPLQTLQPFAIYDSLRRLGLSPAPTNKTSLRLTVFDISGQVLGHVNRSRERAKAKNQDYDLQLPRDPARNLTSAAVNYWKTFGSEIGSPVKPIAATGAISNIETRAIRIRPDVVLSLQPIDLNIVTQRMSLPSADKFDLIVATNMFVYYNTFEQALAMENVASMLKPGGFLLTNDELASLPNLALRKQGSFTLLYTDGATKVGDTMLWYGQK